MENLEKHAKKSNWKQILFLLICYCLVFLAVFCTTYAIVDNVNSSFHFYVIKGCSMQPTINPDLEYNELNSKNGSQDGVLVKKTQEVDYNDIVIIQRPGEDYTIIKRVIALAGDYICIRLNDDGENPDNLFHTYYIKGSDVKKGKTPTQKNVKILDEDYLSVQERTNWTEDIRVSPYDPTPYDGQDDRIYYEKNYYNSFLASSAQYSNEVEMVNVLYNGKQMVFVHLKEDQIFYMGDHRRNSSDSRYRGPAYTNQVIGRVTDIIRDGSNMSEKDLNWTLLGLKLKQTWREITNFFAW